MLGFKNFAIASLLGLAAFATAPAQADLIISCSGSTCSGELAHTGPANTIASYGGGTFGNFTIGALNIAGEGLLGNPLLADISNFEASSSGAGSLNLFFTETGLSAAGVTSFLMNFTDNSLLTGGALTFTRSFYLDPTNGGGTSVLMATCSNAACTLNTQSYSQLLSGLYSITEEIDLTSTGTGSLSSDDAIKLVPEPAALSIFGLGLLALGGMAWRRRSNTNPPAV